jgi:biotin carboxylase
VKPTRELMLVGVGRMGRPYVAAASRLGLRVRAVEAAGRVDALAGNVAAVHACRGELDEHWAEAVNAAVLAGTPDGIVAFSEPQVLAAALLQDALRLPGPSLHAAVLSRNKALQRGRFAAEGVRQPDYLVTDDLESSLDWAAERFPVVIKPLSSAGSAGVELVRDLDAYRELAFRRSGERPLLVETCVEGPEYSWEALLVEGEVRFSNTTAKETTGPPYFVEVAHRTAVQLAPEAARLVDDLTARVLSALRMRTGLVHLEFRLAQAGPTLMEVAVRMPGDFVMDAMGLTYGVDWFELALRAAMSLPLPDAPLGPVRYAASYLPVAAPGVVTQIRGVADITAHPCVVESLVRVAEGDVVDPIRSSAQRVGHVLLAADSPEELEAALAYVRDTLVVCTSRNGVEFPDLVSVR